MWEYHAVLWKYAHFWTDHMIIKFGIEYNIWSPYKNMLFTDITLNIFYAQEHQKGQGTVLFMYSSRRGGYKLLGPLLLPEYGNTPTFDYWLYPQCNSQKIQTWTFGKFWDVWLCLTYPWYWRYMQLNCHIHHSPHICQQQPCLPQSGMAASWSHQALQDMNWPFGAGCLLQTTDGVKIKILNKTLVSAVN